MATRMLIDARHTEETRVAVLKGNRIEEFDFESAEHKQIKGNIYLAKVTRVEPSLQAAFVDFGGNRHGFLAFGEIHPDYYQIPKADRERLLAEEAEAAEEEAQLRAEEEDEGHSPGDEYDADDETGESLIEQFAEDGVEEIDTSEKDDVATIEEGRVEDGDEEGSGDVDGEDEQPRRGRGRGRRQGGGNRSRAKQVDEVRAKRMALRRRYKIQDVIQRRQVLLVQVVKEERGNKGAALTTYLSLAGRYTVLMPNSSHGGGISRKISSSGDRKRLKSIVSDLTLPKAMGLIVRTAGLQRTKPEIKRDFDYLARLWDEIRENTLASTAPALIHSDSDLIKRAIRDIYNKEIEEVVVEGEHGYRSAKEFMKLLMPSHARRVKAYSDPVPLFQRYGAEDQLRAMYDPMVQLKSGGYLVINPTEALVSIDINSGRSTKEHGIEQTALSTNLEAAREIARQLRLRDMAGLIVIDFIDMEHGSNVRKVEKAMKDSLKNDRARIQVGRISGFGLMEMSRQRLRTGVLEATTRDCPHCDGTGLVRTASSAGLSALRLIEDEAAKGRGSTISLHASTEAAVYLLNAKRADLAEIESRYGVAVEVLPEGEQEGSKMRVGSSGPRPSAPPRFDPIVDEDDDDELIEEAEDEIEDDGRADEREQDRDRQDDGDRKRRRRRGGRGRSQREEQDRNGQDRDEPIREAPDPDAQPDDESDEGGPADAAGDDGDRPKKRRRRGGRRRRGRGKGEGDENATSEPVGEGEDIFAHLDDDIAIVAGPDGDTPQTAEAAAEDDKPRKRSRRKKPVPSDAEGAASGEAERTEAEAVAEEPAAEEQPKKRASRRKKPLPSEAERADLPETASADSASGPAEPPQAEEQPKKRPSRRKKPVPSEVEGPVASEAEGGGEPGADLEGADPVTPPADKKAKAKQAANDTASEDDEARPGRRGWWQRTFGE